MPWIYETLIIVNLEKTHCCLACHLLNKLYNGVSFLFSHNSALLCFQPIKEYFEWIWLWATLTVERGKIWPSATTWFNLTVACGSCLPSCLPSSHPAHLVLPPVSHSGCLTSMTFPHLISSLFLHSKVHGCFLDSILQARFPFCPFVYHVVHSGYSLPNCYSS